jgi:gliding motility-associated-like protein
MFTVVDVFEAEDIPVISPVLVDVRVWNIKVVGPSPKIDTVLVDGNGRLRINWQNYICQNASKIFIYRKIDSSSIALDTCQPGMPNGNGFVKIAEVNASETTFLDDNAGKGLKKGPSYCYRIVAIFPDPAGGESLVSNEVCKALPLDIPVIVNVDIKRTDFAKGQILVRWTQPFGIDTNIFKPPYTIQVLRYSGNGNGVLVKSVVIDRNSFALFADTTLLDSNLNTRNTVYKYQWKFIYGSLANLVDSTEKSSSVRLELVPGIKNIKLQWTATTAWTNDGLSHFVYRKIGADFVLIDSVIGFGGKYEYLDEGQFNKVPLEDTIEYCYYVQTKGTYSNRNIASPLVNASQFQCAQPNDTIKPCPPTTFQMDTVNCELCKTAPNCKNCDFLNKSEFSRKLTWHPVFLQDCGRDIVSFKIYYAEHSDDSLTLIATVSDTFFNHSSLTTLAGCYSVTSVDRSGNESGIVNKMCVDNCVVFDLPNTIIPNGDGSNDVFTPSCASRALIEKVHFSVYNRWGQRVFDDDVTPEINWNGITENNKTLVVPGIYFYLAEIQAKRLRKEDEKMIFKGWINVLK